MPRDKRLPLMLVVRISQEMYDTLNILAVAQDERIADVVRRAIRVYLKARRQSESVNVLWDTLLEEERELQ